MPVLKTGEWTGSRPSAAEGGGAPRASLEAGRSPVYFQHSCSQRDEGDLLPKLGRSASRQRDLMSAAITLSVVPANAGTHTHRWIVLYKAATTAINNLGR
jgi:hypothetical protein